jgi:molybdopterin-guanine dinucleotide biosynthesis protein A
MAAESPYPQVAGLVLAGGRSSRFGGPKAAALLGGQSLLQIAAEALAHCCGPVAVSAAPESDADALARALDLPILADAAGDAAGPLSGIKAGLIWAQRQGLARLAVRPVDTPRLPPNLYDDLAEALTDHPAAFCVTANGPQPLCALWTTAALSALHHALADGRHPSVHGFLDSIGAARLVVEDAAAFLNVNTLADLESLSNRDRAPRVWR